VKADAYGHGAVPVARAALAGGATWLAVADGREAAELRAAGIDGPRVLVMGLLSEEELREALAAGGEIVLWNEQQLGAVVAAGGGRVHVKLDTGMGRLGTRDVEQADRVAASARALDTVELAGLMTHFATADELDDDGFFDHQLQRFESWVDRQRDLQPDLVVHAGNSAATLRSARTHMDMVRCGIAIYGMDPFGVDPSRHALEPALELESWVGEVKLAATGESAGYGRRFVAERPTQIGVLPIGYGDGWRRGLSNNAEVLVDGRRRELVGTVSMDSVTIDLGDDPEAQALRGVPATLIGAQLGERILAEDVARRLRTINYEVTCGLTARVPRIHHRDGVELGADAAAALPVGGGT
jgi:alanine racemase